MERSTANLWRRLNSRYNLAGVECTNCKALYFPPRLVCKNCGRNTHMQSKQFSGDGEVYSFTTINVPPEDFTDVAPYRVGIIKLAEGPVVEGHIIENGKTVGIGTKVKMVFRRMHVDGDEGLIHYNFKFEPI